MNVVKSIFLPIVLFILGGCFSNHTSLPKNSPLSLEEKQHMNICSPKEKLSENDLEKIAKTYSVKLDNILKENDICRPRKDVSEIDLTIEECKAKKTDNCKTGFLKVPFS